ncbi:MAG: metallophosphoesterase [Clostridia bacterium]|nr:metallophosphoesterase [Clostridia bacterium]
MTAIIRLLALILSVFIFLPSAGYTGEIEKQDTQACLLSATVLSDMHMESNSRERHERIGKTLQAAKQADNDAVLFLGDNTMNGQWIETVMFYGLVSRNFAAEKVICAPGNHDLDDNENNFVSQDQLEKRFVALRNSFFTDDGENVYFSREVNGYRFIVLGGEERSDENGQQFLSEEQLNWLEDELAEVAKSGKPCFVLNHYLVYGRNGSRSYAMFNVSLQNDRLTEILENSGARTFYFSGHSHYGVNTDSVQTTGNVTYINLPSTGNGGNYVPANEKCAEPGIGMQMEVYADRVVLRFRNYLTEEWLDGFDNYVFALN